jgi:hypothetical protein
MRIELMLAQGASGRAVSRKFKVPYHALLRHWDRHVGDERKASLVIGPVQRQELAARVAEESESVIDHFKAIRAGLYQLYSAALEAGDGTTGAMLAGRLIECSNSMARLTGQLATSPLVQINQQNIFMMPEFTEFQAKLVQVLRPYPDARNAVIAEFERLEMPNPTPKVTYDA